MQAGYRTDAIRSELWSTMAGHLLYGLPATTLLLGLTFLALRRTREFLAEAERRQAAEVRLNASRRSGSSRAAWRTTSTTC